MTFPTRATTAENARGKASIGLAGDPVDSIGRILDRPPALVGEALRSETRLTTRWSHGALHDSLPGLSSHVVMTYYGADQEISWRSGGRRHASRTRPGTITLIPEGHDGRWDIAGPIEVSHVYFPQERLQASADLLAGGKRVELIGRVGFEDPSAARILELLSREARLDDPSSRLFVEQAIDLLCLQLVRGHSSFSALTVEEPRGGLADWQVKRVTAYMREHLEEEIGLDELAATVNLSRFHFCTAFRRATGQTPHQWLVNLRIAQARQLLAMPELPVTEIALSVGYQTPSAFAAAFRKVTATTPTEYRRALLGGGAGELSSFKQGRHP
ncbi:MULTISPECIES: AraC family transcriptional regulator [Sinorhizobium]|uniref:AraC family transcriptional regulator n=1 Tax=Sinorhizobium TaxID=28105 RepID=UPI000BE98C85|nr:MULTISPECIES: AraC family transcriptional regulator [Sinorhizobium]PDT33395.1 AraC family transcriptional regulator [Sinorhizobium sp. FG01]